MPEDLKWIEGLAAQVKKARVERLNAIADGQVTAQADQPKAVFRLVDFGPRILPVRAGRKWAAICGNGVEPRHSSGSG